MRKIALVATRELQSYFNTWMGYVVFAAALFICGLLFNAFALSNEPKFSAQVLEDFFYMTSGIVMFASVILSVRLLAEEKQTGTIVLFYTSPITERQVVYGKFLSALILLGVFLLLSMYMPGLIFVNGKISLGHLASGYLCLLLLAMSTIAITLFASSLSSNQLIAGVLGALFTLTLLTLWLVSPVVQPPFNELLRYMALHDQHFNSMSRGIFHTKDLIYYLSVCFFFLECSIRVLESRRWRG